jgi:hypothetical protein
MCSGESSVQIGWYQFTIPQFTVLMEYPSAFDAFPTIQRIGTRRSASVEDLYLV